jgi:rare lipoprotein A
MRSDGDRWKNTRATGLGVLVLLAAGCGGERRAAALDPARPAYVEKGVASWYGKAFAGRRTASGEVFDPAALTAAHPTLPFGSRVRVTNLANGRTLMVRVNDRGPFVGGRILDCSEAAARQLGFRGRGVAQVSVDWPEDAAPPVPAPRRTR